MKTSINSLLTTIFPARLASLNRAMHDNGAFPGTTWKAHADLLMQTVPAIEEMATLDFGCGPLGGLAQLLPHVTSYDPFVDKFSADPWSREYGVIFSSDVIEHMTVGQTNAFLRQAVKSQVEYLFLNISTRLAYKNLPDGTNAHITVKPGGWWLSHLNCQLTGYKTILAQSNLLREDATFCYRRD